MNVIRQVVCLLEPDKVVWIALTNMLISRPWGFSWTLRCFPELGMSQRTYCRNRSSWWTTILWQGYGHPRCFFSCKQLGRAMLWRNGRYLLANAINCPERMKAERIRKRASSREVGALQKRCCAPTATRNLQVSGVLLLGLRADDDRPEGFSPGPRRLAYSLPGEDCGHALRVTWQTC